MIYGEDMFFLTKIVFTNYKIQYHNKNQLETKDLLNGMQTNKHEQATQNSTQRGFQIS